MLISIRADSDNILVVSSVMVFFGFLNKTKKISNFWSLEWLYFFRINETIPKRLEKNIGIV